MTERAHVVEDDANQKRRSEELLSDKEAYKRVRASPTTQARMDEIAKRIRNGDVGEGPGIDAEELTDFLREHG